MSIEGYRTKKPDAEWWLEQLKAGEEYRKKAAYQAQWDKWRAYYRGDWRPEIQPVNLFFAMLRSTVPRVYFRNPKVSITPGKPGLLHMAFARILERADNKLIKEMKLKNHMKSAIQHTFMFGTGGVKVGFGGQYMPSPTFNPEVDMSGRDKQGHATEFLNINSPMMPWVMAQHPGGLIVPAGLQRFDDTPWQATEVIRALDDVQRDPRFKGTDSLKTFLKEDPGSNYQFKRRRKFVKLYEVRDRRTQRVFVLAPDKDGNKVLFDGYDEFQLVGLPTLPLIFNEDDEYCWGLPDSKLLEPYQKEANEIKTQIMKHRRLSLVKILARRGSISKAEAEKIVNEDVLPVIWTEQDPRMAIEKLQAANIPQDLIQAAQEVVNDMRESVGFSRNQFGEYNSRSGDTTATEARIVQSATEIRVDERRDMVADLLTSVMEHVNTVIFNHWGEEQIVDIVGPGGAPVWVQFQGKMLRQGHYHIKVDPDSSLPETRELRERRAIELYSLLKSNPLIDPQMLTQYLLNELRGTAFDDMMRMLPPVAQPNGSVGPADYAQMIGQSVGQASQQGGLRPLPGGGK